MSVDGARRSEILEHAASLFASTGIRTSVKDIADASGILPGSLYHHFASKEAIIVELVERYRTELDAIAEDAADSDGSDQRPVETRLVELGTRIAQCASRHRAALLLTLYDPPSAAGDELVEAANLPLPAIESAMRTMLERGRREGTIRKGIDLSQLSDRFCQVLLHSSLPVFSGVRGADEVPALRCRLLLRGLAVDPIEDADLDGSAAFAAATVTIDSWEKDDADKDARLPILFSAARREFGRRGYEATTVRDIAKAAEMSVGSVYRLVGSKDELLASIMRAFVVVARSGWSSVLGAPGSTVEKLDALTWVNINAVDRFSDEYNVQLAFMRESPPKTVNLGVSFAARLGDLRSLLARGTRADEIRVDGPSSDIRAWSVFELLWMPESIVAGAGPRGALQLARQTTLRGAGAD